MQSNVRRKDRDLELLEFDAPGNTGRTQTIDIIGSPRYKNTDKSYIAERRKARRRRAYFYRALAFVMLVSVIVLACFVFGYIYKFFIKESEPETVPVINTQPINEAEEPKIAEPEIEVDLLEVNEYSRPATRLNKIKNIFVHYTANPETSAKQNRSYFANLEETHERSASAHYIIGYEGEIIQCIPLDEQAYAVMTRNDDSISIECCYLDEDGQFTQETYDSLVHLLAWLRQEYDLESEDILRHYDCGGKLCPLYYVEHEDAWAKLLRDVERYED
ncbi:MAG: N-acetylmuramoyl-L-alanine amidase [Lachnospiraceae bacterium]|nr:N-acetylmuramoyl-L-alanine amidase [Lachnospiraceae bacterium]